MKKTLTAAFILTSLTLGLRTLASFYLDQRLWGLNQAGFFDYLFLIYPIIFAVVLYLYLRGRQSPSADIGRSDINLSSAGIRPAWIAVFAVMGGLLFYFFSVRAYFLGDSLTLISNMANPDYGIKYRNFGEAVLHMELIRLFGSYTEESVAAIYRWTSVISGVSFIVILFYYAPRLTASRLSGYTFIVLNFFAAHALLYYGYVENYTIAITLIFLMIFSGAASLRRGKKSIIPVAAFFLAVIFHSLNIIYLPGILIYAALTFAGKKVKRFVNNNFRFILAAGVVLFAATYAIIKFYGPLFWQVSLLPVLKGRFTIDNYYLLSPNHLLDFINVLLFLAPFAVFTWIFELIAKDKGQKKKPSGDSNFILIIMVFCLLAAFVIEPRLGMARDWDLMSLMLAGGTVWGIYKISQLIGNSRQPMAVSLMLVMLSISIFLPWLILHNSPKILYSYAIAAMRLDPKHSYSGLITMHNYNKNIGNVEEAETIARLNEALFPERSFEKEASRAYQQADPGSAVYYLKKAISENPQRFEFYLDLGVCYLRMAQYGKAIEELQIADGLNPYNWEVNFNLGQAYQLRGDSLKAIELYRKSISHNSSMPEPYVLIGEYFLSVRQPDSALAYLTALPDSAYPERVFYDRGMAHLLKGDTTLALNTLNQYLLSGKDDRMLKQVENLIKNIKK